MLFYRLKMITVVQVRRTDVLLRMMELVLCSQSVTRFRALLGYKFVFVFQLTMFLINKFYTYLIKTHHLICYYYFFNSSHFIFHLLEFQLSFPAGYGEAISSSIFNLYAYPMWSCVLIAYGCLGCM